MRGKVSRPTSLERELEEIAKIKQRLASLNGRCYSLAVDEEARILATGENFTEVWQNEQALQNSTYREDLENVAIAES